MKFRRHSKSLNEPPQIMLTDLAFNLLIFFVVCASTEPETGRKQAVPSGSKEQAQSQTQGEQNIEVKLLRTAAMINGEGIALTDFPAKMKELLAGKTKPEQRLVVVKTEKDTPYHFWIRMTGLIEKAGGVIAVVVEETRTVPTP